MNVRAAVASATAAGNGQAIRIVAHVDTAGGGQTDAGRLAPMSHYSHGLLETTALNFWILFPRFSAT